jgi:outer membrane protein assembly factor BamC
MSIQRDGTARWLVVKNRSFDQLWPEVRKFWEEQGFLLVVDNRNSGVMETDWNETHAQVDLDLVRGLLSKALDNAYVTGERNKYRTRFEKGPDGSIYIFVSQKGMHEVVSGVNHDSSTWEVRPNDPGLEAIYLTRLMDSLGRQESGGPVAVAAAPAAASGAKALPQITRPAGAPDASDADLIAKGAPPVVDHEITLPESYDRVWLRTGLALDRANFTVDDRNRETGIYSIRYVDPTDMSVEEQGFWHQVFHGKKEKKALNFRVNVKALTETSTRVALVNDSGAVLSTAQADRILHLIADQMR